MHAVDRQENLLHCQYKHIALSSFIYRSFTERVPDSIEHENRLMQMMCLRNNWVYIDKDSIDNQCLSSDGLLLNGLGSEALRLTFAKGVKKLLHTINH